MARIDNVGMGGKKKKKKTTTSAWHWSVHEQEASQGRGHPSVNWTLQVGPISQKWHQFVVNP
jgi:hypothetical protein